METLFCVICLNLCCFRVWPHFLTAPTSRPPLPSSHFSTFSSPSPYPVSPCLTSCPPVPLPSFVSLRVPLTTPQGCHGNGLFPGTHPWCQPEWGIWQFCPGLLPRKEDFGRTRLPHRCELCLCSSGSSMGKFCKTLCVLYIIFFFSVFLTICRLCRYKSRCFIRMQLPTPPP